jgi:phage/plasmid-associated DNA primase
MTVRELHMKPIEVNMRCLSIICTNALSKFNVSDLGTLKKLRVFPFTREFVDKPCPDTNKRLIDFDLVDKINTPEWRKQMLAWLVCGSMAWYAKGGLRNVEELPEAMQRALDGYIQTNDHFNNFIADHCILRERKACHVDVLKQAYENYIERRDRPMIVTEFKVLMQGLKGVTYAKQIKVGNRNTTGYRGICLRC